jgi:hypothetical protein
MEEQINLFLSLFKRLKKEVNNSPKTLSWLAKERDDIQDLCYELEENYQTIAKFLATKNIKHTLITVPFENDWKEYELNYQKHVLIAAEPSKESHEIKLKDLIKYIEMDCLEAGMTKKECDQVIDRWVEKLYPPGSSFNPLNDDPASLMDGIQDYILNKDSGNEFFDKALGAWFFYEDSIGLDLKGIYSRWKTSPELFIPIHVHATTNTVPLIELYNEAVKSFAFGNKVASMTMCRALMEYILKKYYGIKADDLEKIIAIAEQKFPNLVKLKMQNKRKIANNILHDYEKKSENEDKAVIEFLMIIKYLVQHIPAKRK